MRSPGNTVCPKGCWLLIIRCFAFEGHFIILLGWFRGMVDVLSVTGSVTGLVVYAGIENRHLGLQTLYTPGVPPVPEASTTYSIYCKSLTGI